MKTLVVYYSFSGRTKELAEDIGLIADSDIIQLKPREDYDFTLNTTVKTIRLGMEGDYSPKLIAYEEEPEAYDLIFIGSPNWLGTYAPPLRSFLRAHNFENKTLVPFLSHGGGGFGSMIKDLEKESKAKVYKEGFKTFASYDFEILENWVKLVLKTCSS